MKHLKTYENLNIKPKVGDYVVCTESNGGNKLINFIENSVGQIVLENPNFSVFKYLVKYENIPEKMKKWFSFTDGSDNGDCRPMDESEILYISNSKEYCEFFLISKKYNI